MKRLESLQALRGLGALAIMAYHYRYFVQDGDNALRQLLDALLSKAIVGVDLFFVLSGFIIIITTSEAQKGGSSALRFISNRLKRVLPMYYIGLAFSLLALVIYKPHEDDGFANIISAITFTVYDVNHAPNYIPFSGAYNIRWTINYEMYFYFLFSISLLMKRRIAGLMLLILAPIVLTPLAFNVDFGLHTRAHFIHNPFISLISNPLMIEFTLGCISGLLYLKAKNLHLNDYPLPFFFALLTVSVIFITLIYNDTIIPLGIGSGIFFCIILFLLSLSEKAITPYIPKFLIHIGDISFSFYLLHMSICTIIFAFAWRLKLDVDEIVAIILCTISFILTYVTSNVSHKHIEIRLSSALTNLISKKGT